MKLFNAWNLLLIGIIISLLAISQIKAQENVNLSSLFFNFFL